MFPRIKKYCELAECAREDKSLIPNHTLGGNGIPDILKREIVEIQEIYDLVKDDPDEVEFVDSLTCEIKEIKHALTAYD